MQEVGERVSERGFTLDEVKLNPSQDEQRDDEIAEELQLVKEQGESPPCVCDEGFPRYGVHVEHIVARQAWNYL